MKRCLSALMILLAVINIFATCATTVSLAGDLQDVIPPAPEGVSAVNSAVGVSVTWQMVENTAGYKIYRCESGGEYSEIADVRGFATTSYTDSSAESGKEYFYIVKAYNAFNEGELSVESVVICLSQPTIISADPTYGGIEIVWERVNGAEGYTLYRKNGGVDEPVAEIDGDGTTAYVDINVENGKKYSYTVIAHSGVYTSSFAYKTSGVYVIAPTLKKVKNYNGYVRVYWEATSTADKYRVYRKPVDGKWEHLGTVSKKYTSFKDDTIKNGGQYIYTVRAVDGKYKSGYDGDGISASYVSAPKDVTLKNYYSNSIRVKWAKVSNATKYVVYRKDNKNTDLVKIGETTSTQFKDTTTENGKVYTYSVKAKGKNGGTSGYSKNVKLTALKRPTEVKLTCTTEGVKISWTKMSTATGYRIYKKASGSSDWELIKKVSSGSTTSYTDKKVKDGKSYSYRVLQVKGSTKGCYLKDGVSIKFVKAPVLYANHSPKGVVLSWNRAKTGTGYQVQRKAEGEKKWKTLATINSLKTLTYTDAKPEYGKKNDYRIVVTASSLVSDSFSIYGINPKKKMVALTYDDGPYTQVTNRILDALEENNGRATFFVVGSRVNTYKDCIKREAAMGCEIANHTYNHTILTSVSASTIKSEISKTNDAVKKITGVAPTIVRTPGGAVNASVRKNIGYPMFNWSIDTLDWKNRNAGSVVSSIKSNVRDGSIVLMHDLYGSTASASEEIIPWLVKKGYQLVTVSEMMAVKGITMESGELYTKAY